MISVFDRLEAVAGQTVRRDISRLVQFASGNLEKAAKSIAEHPSPNVGIVTGFFVRHAEPPSPETDGLNGLGHLAAGLTEAGIKR
jgi:D-glutamate cyclase